ncbi:MAG: S41 family peptidase [Deltaproteobacteria bacterium]|jgi:carboxyl-terminal processing protease|nr:S41 family peptidase [Deltaproteobacteria bacterium]
MFLTSQTADRSLWRRTAFWLSTAVLVSALSLFVVGISPARAASSDFKIYEGFKTLARVFYEINVRFVEEPDSTEMVHGAVRGMLNTLDPHSSYMTPEEMSEFQQEATGSFTGVGMELSSRDSVLTVVSPIDDTPASRAGIMSGDQIVSIDEKSTKDMTVMEAVKLIRGPKGTAVTIEVYRPSNKRTLSFPLTRDFIPLRSVRSEELSPGIGYIHISNFQGDTANEVEKAVVKLSSKKPMSGLVLDLRNDPGGLLDQSVKVSGLFVGPVMVVETRGRIDDQNMGYSADDQAILPYQCPIVVLVNEGSASASEIVAGALQDYGRALILGARTFGKGSVQSVVRLPDGSGLRLTTARFYTPSGRAIQSDGIVPDVLVPSLLPTKFKVTREVDLDRHLLGPNEVPKKDDEKSQAQAEDEEGEDDGPLLDKPLYEMSLKERLEVDKQLARALELLQNGRVKSRFTGVVLDSFDPAMG